MWMGSHGVVCGLTSGHTDSGLVLIPNIILTGSRLGSHALVH